MNNKLIIHLTKMFPSEIILRIFRHADISTLSALSRCSRQYHRLSNDDRLWKHLLKRDYVKYGQYYFTSNDNKSKYKSLRSPDIDQIVIYIEGFNENIVTYYFIFLPDYRLYIFSDDLILDYQWDVRKTYTFNEYNDFKPLLYNEEHGDLDDDISCSLYKPSYRAYIKKYINHIGSIDDYRFFTTHRSIKSTIKLLDNSTDPVAKDIIQYLKQLL